MPAVSIIIPTYNHAHLITRCLGSVVGQTFPDWEAIVVNNYSTDNTIEVVQSFADNRIRLINFKNNGIIAASRNTGIQAASGDWLAFLDSDDWWYPEKLELSSRHFSNADVIYHDLRIFNGKRKILKKTAGRQVETPVFSDLMTRGNALSTSGVMTRKEVVEKAGSFSEDRDLVAVEDFDLWLRIARLTEKFVFIRKVLGAYLLSASGTSFSSDNYYRNTLYLYRKHLEALPAVERERSEMFLTFILGRIQQRRGLHRQSRELFRKSCGSRDWKIRMKSLILIAYLTLSSRAPAGASAE